MNVALVHFFVVAGTYFKNIEQEIRIKTPLGKQSLSSVRVMGMYTTRFKAFDDQ